MKEQMCDMNTLYHDVSENFNEVDYLSNVARLRAEFRNLMGKKGIIDSVPEGRPADYMLTDSKEYREPNSFPDQCNRIGKNGAITVEFDQGVPAKFYTPYGAIQVHDFKSLDWGSVKFFAEDKQNKFFKQMAEKYGLVQVGGSQKNPVYAITKMPEIKKSILPWKSKVAVPAKNLPMPTKGYQTNRPESDQNIDYDLAKNPEYYQDYYKNAQYMAPEFVRENEHLQKVFDVVNVKCVQDKHPEYIMPGTVSRPKIRGIGWNFKAYLKKVPNALELFSKALQEDNAKNATMRLALKEMHKDSGNHMANTIQEPIINVINNDLGREM